MNLIADFQNLVAQVPELIQPLIVALAAAVPFIEGEGAVVIGIVGGIHPVVAAIAAMVGNFACVAVLVLLSSRTRRAIVDRSRARRAATVGAPGQTIEPVGGAGHDELESLDPSSGKARRREKFRRAFERYGVPGVSLLGPLLLPTQFTATMLAAAGIGRGRVLLWQGVAIVMWTTLLALFVTGVLNAVG